jgi:hypothetical protein
LNVVHDFILLITSSGQFDGGTTGIGGTIPSQQSPVRANISAQAGLEGHDADTTVETSSRASDGAADSIVVDVVIVLSLVGGALVGTFVATGWSVVVVVRRTATAGLGVVVGSRGILISPLVVVQFTKTWKKHWKALWKAAVHPSIWHSDVQASNPAPTQVSTSSQVISSCDSVVAFPVRTQIVPFDSLSRKEALESWTPFASSLISKDPGNRFMVFTRRLGKFVPHCERRYIVHRFQEKMIMPVAKELAGRQIDSGQGRFGRLEWSASTDTRRKPVKHGSGRSYGDPRRGSVINLVTHSFLSRTLEADVAIKMEEGGKTSDTSTRLCVMLVLFCQKCA